MNPQTTHKKTPWLRPLAWCALGAALALSACGGDDDDNQVPAPPPSGGQPSGDRIEPLNTAQLKQQRQPVAQVLRRLPDQAQVAEVVLGPLPTRKSSAAAAPGQPLQIGVGRELAVTATAAGLAGLLHWQTLADGSQVAALRFVAEGAAGLRLGWQLDAWPQGAKLRLQGAPGSEVLDLPLPADAATRLRWSPDVEGAQATLELELPPGVDTRALQLAVPQLSHLTQTVAQAVQLRDTSDVGNAASCHQNAVCTLSDSESRAVAKLLFTDMGGSYLCTGTLLNDHGASQTPYLLTAAHCIDSARAADSLVTYWFFRAAACGSGQVDAAMQRLTGGALLLQAHLPTDTSLLQLRQAPPAGVVYAGSYFGAGVGMGQQVLGLHHPMGDLLKASQGQIRSYYNCNSQGWCSGASADNGMLYEVRWSQGTTEGGSSGSALFAGLGGTRYVVGALHGGNASCSNPGGSDFYGRYGLAFDAGLRRWLWP